MAQSSSKSTSTEFKHVAGLRFFRWICGALSILIIIVFSFELHFFLTATETDGEVTKLNAGGSHVRVEFMTSSGEKIKYPQNGIISYKVGDKVRVFYDKENPERASTSAVGALWSWTIILSTISAAFGFFTMMAFRYPKIFVLR
jgi:hypothetical protein